jgi:pSer/pThr/pTyr-binding forkhead associated (FHA) protein
MNSALAVLLFRLGIAIVLYGFLAQVLRATWRGLERRPGDAALRQRGARLEIVQPAQTRLRPGDIVPIGSAITIGREPGNGLVVDEDTVSGSHSRVLLRDGFWWIEDLGSTNGTLVNEVQIGPPKRLGPGDLIQIGRVRFRFNV